MRSSTNNAIAHESVYIVRALSYDFDFGFQTLACHIPQQASKPAIHNAIGLHGITADDEDG